MLVIDCPYCGPRPEMEFRYGGEAHIARPEDPQALSDAEWADYLFMKSNTSGWHRERWMHAAGCRRWFNAIRNTISYKFAATYVVGEPRPNLPEEGSKC